MRGRALALLASGVERFDAAEVRFVDALLERAASSREGVRARLEERAKKHMFALELRFRSAEVRSKDAIAELARHDPAQARELRERAASGDVDGARRAAERTLAQRSERRTAPALARLRGALELVERSCSTLPPVVREAREALDGKTAPEDDLATRAHDLANRLDLVLLSDGLEQLSSLLEVDRMERAAPLAAGPYNPDALAARCVGELSALSPSFARAWLAWVKDVESLSRLPPTADEKPAKAAKATRTARGGTRVTARKKR
jgi:hypothetical protein